MQTSIEPKLKTHTCRKKPHRDFRLMPSAFKKAFRCPKDSTHPLTLQHCWFVKTELSHSSMPPGFLRNFRFKKNKIKLLHRHCKSHQLTLTQPPHPERQGDKTELGFNKIQVLQTTCVVTELEGSQATVPYIETI